jgi:hypothetical protein
VPYIVFVRGGLVWWRIIPTVTHRNCRGRTGFPSQHRQAWATRRGLADLFAYIEAHDRPRPETQP